ncbi:MAG TPA: DNA ligase, partial [Thermococcus sp.]|nr:DNA ligase [Thermococcus sp.]
MLLRDLIDCYEKVRSTTSKLEKIDIVASFLKKLDDEDIPIACYILTGKAFPEWTGKELNVGWSTLWDCIRKVSGVSEKELFEAFD